MQIRVLVGMQVFRTFNASITLDRLLWEEEEDEAEASLDHKKALYDRANKEVRTTLLSSAPVSSCTWTDGTAPWSVYQAQ